MKILIIGSKTSIAIDNLSKVLVLKKYIIKDINDNNIIMHFIVNIEEKDPYICTLVITSYKLRNKVYSIKIYDNLYIIFFM